MELVIDDMYLFQNSLKGKLDELGDPVENCEVWSQLIVKNRVAWKLLVSQLSSISMPCDEHAGNKSKARVPGTANFQCGECLANGDTRHFPSAKALLSHQRKIHGVGIRCGASWMRVAFAQCAERSSRAEPARLRT